MLPRVKYKKRSSPPIDPLNRMGGTTEEEVLTGYVNGKAASDLEERWAGAERRAGREFIFLYIVDTPFQLPGEGNQIDFMDTTNVWQPIEIDGNFAHKSAQQRAEDDARDAILNQALAEDGILPIARVPGDDIPTPEEADRVLREIMQ